MGYSNIIDILSIIKIVGYFGGMIYMLTTITKTFKLMSRCHTLYGICISMLLTLKRYEPAYAQFETEILSDMASLENTKVSLRLRERMYNAFIDKWTYKIASYELLNGKKDI